MATTGGHRASGAQDPNGRGDSTTRRQQEAGFSLFVDQLVDEQGRLRWESRLYHNESGAETTFVGAAPDQWIDWILARLGPTMPGPRPGDDAPDPEVAQPPVVEVASVEVLDVSVDAAERSGVGSIHTIRAQLIVQLTGIALLERELGWRVLGGIAKADRYRSGPR